MSDWITKVEFDNISPDRPCGFEGFLPVRALVESACAEIPEKRGVYLLLAPDTAEPGFNADNPGYAANRFTPKDAGTLRGQWNDGARVVYIGKAGAKGKDATLRSRLIPYLVDWFHGKSSGHRGGRDIWQLNNAADLLVAWRVTEDEEEPRDCESALIQKFKAEHGGRRPFANLKD